MKRLTVIIGLFCCAFAYAQQTHVDEIWIDTRASFHQDWTDGQYNSHFQGDYLNLHIKGQLTDQLSFRIRQRLNKRIDDQNPFNATDFLCKTVVVRADPKAPLLIHIEAVHVFDGAICIHVMKAAAGIAVQAGAASDPEDAVVGLDEKNRL